MIFVISQADYVTDVTCMRRQISAIVTFCKVTMVKISMSTISEQVQ